MAAADAYPLTSPIELSDTAPVLFSLSNTSAPTSWRVETDASNNFLVGTAVTPGWLALNPTTGETAMEIAKLNQELRFPIGANTTTIKASPSLVSNNTLTLPLDVGTVNYVMKTDGTGVLSFVDVNTLVTGGGTGFNSVEAGGRTVSTLSSTFQTAFVFSFPGTTSLGSISSVNVIIRGSSSNTVEVRLVDITNAQVVAGPTQLINTGIDTLLALTSITGMPPGAAIFELQHRKVSGPNRSRVTHVSVNALTASINSVEAGGRTVSTNNSTFQTAFTFSFPGTSSLGLVNAVSVIIRGSSSNTVEARLVDITNSQVVAGPTQLINTGVDTLLSLTSITGMPAGAAIFELQHRKVSGSNRSRVTHVSVQSI